MLTLADAIARSGKLGHPMDAGGIQAFGNQWRTNHPRPNLPSMPSLPPMPTRGQPFDVNQYLDDMHLPTIPQANSLPDNFNPLPANFDPMTYQSSTATPSMPNHGGFGELGRRHRQPFNLDQYLSPQQPY